MIVAALTLLLLSLQNAAPFLHNVPISSSVASQHRSHRLILPSTLTLTTPKNAYAFHWETLLTLEHQEKVAEYAIKRKTWSPARLEESGMSIFGASAEPDSDLFGEKIVRIYKKGACLRDRFTRGDVLVMRQIGGPETMPRECLVVDVGKEWITVGVGPTWPSKLWEARKILGSFRVRLDRTAPQAPLRTQKSALDLIRRGKAGDAAALLADLFSSGNNTNTPIHPFFASQKLEEQTREALRKAKGATSFEPNESQEEAIVWALQRPLSLIRGPPGTGKTRTAALLISTALRVQSESAPMPRILAVTHSNGAADVLLAALIHMGVPAIRVGRPASVSANLQHRTVMALAERHPEVVDCRERARDASLSTFERSAAMHEIKRRVAEVQKLIVSTAPVVVTSCIGAYQLYEEGTGVTFPLVVLDEAAQTTEPALLCALTAARSNQLCLVGDTNQLSPTVTLTALRDTLGVSPMARLEKLGVEQRTLRVQYRMPPSLLKHPSDYFYGGLVTCADEVCEIAAPSGFPWPSKLPLVFVHVGSNLEVSHDFGGKSNPTEARLVAKVVVDLIGSGDVESNNIAVISPYSKQVQLIRSELSLQRNASSVRVGTVDSFQGQETDIVVFSCTRSNDRCEIGFLRDSRRLCVAITRARRGLIIIGDQKVLKTCRHWSALLASCTARDCVMDAKCLDLQSDRIILRVDGPVESNQIGDLTGEEESFKTLFGDQIVDDEQGLLFRSNVTTIVEKLDTKSS
jgi:hypothetical protein